MSPRLSLCLPCHIMGEGGVGAVCQCGQYEPMIHQPIPFSQLEKMNGIYKLSGFKAWTIREKVMRGVRIFILY
jgi:hypothetical protein